MLKGAKKRITEHHSEITFLKNTDASLIRIFYSSKQFLRVSLRVNSDGLPQKNCAKAFASEWPTDETAPSAPEEACVDSSPVDGSAKKWAPLVCHSEVWQAPTLNEPVEHHPCLKTAALRCITP